jgi:hypothetical protein
VRDWPPISDPELLARLGLDRDGFIEVARGYAQALGRRDLPPGALERALGYPWARPARSYLLEGGEPRLLSNLDPGERERLVARFARERYPILAFGSNAAPTTLQAKFADLDPGEDRTVLVAAGELCNFDVGAAANPTLYGSMPAALFESPGTAVRAATLWVTAAQATRLTWSEVPYQLGRLDAGHFVVDEADIAVDTVFAYVHRLGALRFDGELVALEAVAATGRTAKALSQEELLDHAAGRIVGPEARAADLVQAVFADMSAVFSQAQRTLWPDAIPLAPDSWTPFGAA